MRIPNETPRPAEINIVPLIDVIFCILVFFIVASLVLTRTEGLDVNLPSASTAQPRLQPDVTVSVAADGAIAVNDKENITVDNLVNEINQALSSAENAAGASAERLIVLNADLSITHGNVVEVMNALRQIPNARLAIAARRPAATAQ